MFNATPLVNIQGLTTLYLARQTPKKPTTTTPATTEKKPAVSLLVILRQNQAEMEE